MNYPEDDDEGFGSFWVIPLMFYGVISSIIMLLTGRGKE